MDGRAMSGEPAADGGGLALLRDLVRREGRMRAAERLGVSYKTLARAQESGRITPRMRATLERLRATGGAPTAAVGELAALLGDLVRREGRMRATKRLGVNYRTLVHAQESGRITPRMRTAIDLLRATDGAPTADAGKGRTAPRVRAAPDRPPATDGAPAKDADGSGRITPRVRAAPDRPPATDGAPAEDAEGSGLLGDLVRREGRMRAAERLGVNYKTLARAQESGRITPRMRAAPERLRTTDGAPTADADGKGRTAPRVRAAPDTPGAAAGAPTADADGPGRITPRMHAAPDHLSAMDGAPAKDADGPGRITPRVRAAPDRLPATDGAPTADGGGSALLGDLVRREGRMRAAERLDVNYKTLARAQDSGRITPRMRAALERLRTTDGDPETVRLRERVDALEGRMDALAGAVRAREAVTAADADDGEDADVVGGADRWAPRARPRTPGPLRSDPEVVTAEPAGDDDAVYGAARPLVAEWRALRADHPHRGGGLSWLTREERLLGLELAMLEEHGLTLPPETQPLRGLGRRAQTDWRVRALEDVRRALGRRLLLRGLRRILTLGLWWR